jgi:hypothetical protein
MQSLDSSPTNQFNHSPMFFKINPRKIELKSGLPKFNPQINWPGKKKRYDGC